MNLAIFGGSGVIGRVLLPVLSRQGHNVRAMVHNTPLPLDGIETVEGSMSEPAGVTETIGDAKVVLQMTKGGDGIEQLVETSVRGTANILDCSQEIGTVRHRNTVSPSTLPDSARPPDWTESSSIAH